MARFSIGKSFGTEFASSAIPAISCPLYGVSYFNGIIVIAGGFVNGSGKKKAGAI